MTVEGFCVVERTDVPVDSDRYCLTHQTVTIPPSWGRRGMRWTGSGWEGDAGRPPGYVYVPRFADAPEAVTGDFACERCGAITPRKAKRQRFCGDACKAGHHNARRRIAAEHRRDPRANLKQYAGRAS
jgi:hypothetical protein